MLLIKKEKQKKDAPSRKNDLIIWEGSAERREDKTLGDNTLGSKKIQGLMANLKGSVMG